MSATVKVDIRQLPHGEGLASPVAFTEELKGFSEGETRKVMRDNAVEFLGFKPN